MPYSLQRGAALILILALSGPMAIIALLILCIDGRPVLFRQVRAGRHMKGFKLFKFRTMKNHADALIKKGEDPKNRITRTGSVLRKSGLDELPQLVNVVRGEMALIGPRAMLPEVSARVPARYAARFDVLPGITGLAQVRGRNSIPWSKRLGLDIEYLRRRSLLFDLQIAFRTIAVLLQGAGHVPDRNTSKVDDLNLMGGDNE